LARGAWFLARVILPHRIATLLYCFNQRGEVLLMERAREPNKGLWSPPGGKLKADAGESPHACAAREAEEEMGLKLEARELRLFGMVSEEGYQGQAHWLMFLYEVGRKLLEVPPPHAEGRFEFFGREQFAGLPLPRTDAEQIWPLVWAHRGGGFFAARCRAGTQRDEWMVEESRPA